MTGRSPSPEITLHGPVPDMRKDWLWCCEDCGWRGIGLPNKDAAAREAGRHVCPKEDDHA